MEENIQFWMVQRNKFWFQKTLDIFDLCCWKPMLSSGLTVINRYTHSPGDSSLADAPTVYITQYVHIFSRIHSLIIYNDQTKTWWIECEIEFSKNLSINKTFLLVQKNQISSDVKMTTCQSRFCFLLYSIIYQKNLSNYNSHVWI